MVIDRKDDVLQKEATLPGPERKNQPSVIGESFARRLFKAVVRGIALYLLASLASKYFFGKSPGDGSAASDPKAFHYNAWKAGQRANVYVYVSDEAIQMSFSPSQLVMEKDSIEFGTFSAKDATTEVNVRVPLASSSARVGKNGDVLQHTFAHIYIVKEGYHPDPTKSAYSPTSTIYHRVTLTGVMAKPKAATRLLSQGNESAEVAHSEKSGMVPYWYPELHISLVQDDRPIAQDSITENLAPHIKFVMGRAEEGRRRSFLPLLYASEGWRLRSKQLVLEETLAQEVPLRITLSYIGWWKLRLLVDFENSFRINEKLFGADGEMEKMKEMITETNPYLLAITIIVSCLHSLFDLLAFKNDIQFWKRQKNLEGLSVRSVLLNALVQLIIFLYLLDQETSTVVLVSAAVGTLIEFWKITRALAVTITFSRWLPSITVKDRATYSRSDTQLYDEQAMRYLGIAAIPFLGAYSIYSLIYEDHKGWYSWIIGTLVGFVYTFGFAAMLPQLFINYKLKSVAHIPWKVFVYKALNTFVDDLFAFVIKMPMLHRLACFRDDIVFFIFLYQRWIYPTDKARPNEYGQVFGDESKDPQQDKKSAISDASPEDASRKVEADGKRQVEIPDCNAKSSSSTARHRRVKL